MVFSYTVGIDYSSISNGLLLLGIQKHSLDGGNCVPELFKLIFETTKQSNLLERKS